MKTIIRKTLLLTAVVVFAATFAVGQRVIKGTVYREGKPQAGVTVEAQKGSSMMTSFDGKYEINVDPKSKWIKFTFIDDEKRLDLTESSGDVIDFAFDGKMPGENSANSNANGVVLKSQEELIKEQNQEYMNEFSMYGEFYKQEDFKSALPHWRNLYNRFPKSSPNVYIQGTKMFQEFIDKAPTPEEKEKNLQELMNIYDNRIKHFGERGYVLGRKGYDWFKYKLESNPELEERKAIMKNGYEWINTSVNELGNASEAPVLVLLMQTSVALFKLGELSKETVISNYDKCTSIINTVIKENKDVDQVSRMKEIQPHIESIFGTSGAADCEALVNIFTPQYQEKSNDIEFIKSMLNRLGRANCDESELFSQATLKLYELEPSALAAYNMARRFIKQGDIVQAKEFYKKAMEQETDKELLATYYLQYAKVLYSESSFSEARSYARKVLDINAENCEANMLIGDIYVAASRSFSGSNIEKGAIFWLAVDYYTKARRGEDCAIDASQKAIDYRRYFPGREDAFMEGLQEGQNYLVGGWINESTRVRF